MSDTLRTALKGSGRIRVSIQQGNNKDFFLEAIEDWARLTKAGRAAIKAGELAAAEDPDGMIWETLKTLVQDCHINREVRERVAALTAPQNDPLTPEQLRKMDEEPVWIEGEGQDRWDIFCGISTDDCACFWRVALPMENIGKTWTPYRRKPEQRKEERNA